MSCRTAAARAARSSRQARPPRSRVRRSSRASPRHRRLPPRAAGDSAHAGMTDTATAHAAVGTDGLDAREGGEGIPRENGGQGEHAARADDGRQGEGLPPHRAAPVKWEVDAGQVRRCVRVQRTGAGAADPRAGRGPGADQSSRTICPRSTAIHFHGVEVPERQDGVPYITQPPVKPGAVVHLRVHGAELRLAHVPLAPQLHQAGRHGAARRVHRRTQGAAPDRAEGGHGLRDDPQRSSMAGYTLNGKGFPATEPIVAKRGQTVRIRFMNEGQMIHPMHLHGMHDDRDRQGRWPTADAVEVRHAERRAGRAVGRARGRAAIRARGRSTATSCRTRRARWECSGWSRR